MERNKIKSEKRVFDNYFKVDEAIVEHSKKDGSVVELSRMKLIRPDAVAVLLYNTETDRVILVRQFRYPIADIEWFDVLEIVAGKMDAGETPEQTAMREVLEETGYKITKESLMHLTSMYSSPGYSTEKVHVFVSFADNSMIVGEGGGLETENESIEIVEVDHEKFFKMIDDGKICDSKTIVAAMMLFRSSIQKVIGLGYSIKSEK